LSKSSPLTSVNIREAMFDSVVFEGASGEIDISGGDPKVRAGHNQGTRLGGVHYQLLNFNEDVYLGLGEVSANTTVVESDGFVAVMVWSLETGLRPCPADLGCPAMVFDNSPSSKVPNDTRPVITMVFSDTTRVFFLGVLLIFVSLIYLILTIRFRALAEVQNSQEFLLYCILLGGILAGCRVINAGLPLSDKTCVVGFWLGNLSFWLAVMAFFLKSWRVSQLLAIKSIKRVRITTGQIMRYMFLSVLFIVGMLVILTVVGDPHYQETVTESANQETVVPFCSMTHPEVQTVLYVIYALLLGTNLRICWSLREVPKKFSDFHTIGSGEVFHSSILPFFPDFQFLALVVIIAFSVFVMPIYYLLKLRHDLSSAIANVAFSFTALIVLMVIFAHKFYSLSHFAKSSAKVLDETRSQPTSGVSNTVQIFSQDVIRSMNPDEQFEYYTKIIMKYSALRLQISCGSENSSHVSVSASAGRFYSPSEDGPPLSPPSIQQNIQEVEA
jgi:hypothetical protein